MKLIKQYTAVQVYERTVNDTVEAHFEYGSIKGPYYSRTEPTKEFETEGEAIEYAYKFDKWATWIILPVVRFDNIDE